MGVVNYLSSLSDYFKLSLEATFLNLVEQENICEKSIERLEQHHDYEKARQIIRTQRHCDGSVSSHMLAMTENYIFYTCPCQFYNSDLQILIDLVSQRKQGCLPFSGGYLEQPSVLIQAMDYIESLLNNYKEKQRKKEDRKTRMRKKN